MVEAGELLKTIGEFFGGKHTPTIRKWMERHGIARAKVVMRPRGITPRYVANATLTRTRKRRSCKIYQAWERIRHRCKSQYPKYRRHYADRGIKCCAEWASYHAFRAWSLKNGVRRGLVFQRLNTARDFEPGNCCWSTVVSRNLHSRTTEWITFNGETLPSPVWAKRLGLKPEVLRGRFNNGWTVEDALTVPKGKNRPGMARGRRPYPPELREAIAAYRALNRAIEERIHEEQDR